jgi:glycosyltransferase involved in cell wall biosynthesis
MIVSFYTHMNGLRLGTGYGQAGYGIVSSLQKLGYKVPFNDHEADVQLMFTQPPDYNFGPSQFSIGYTPWESDEMPDSWLQNINRPTQFWATSHLNKKWYEDQGVVVDKVFPHGISDIWTPRQRIRRRKLKFLHIGSPAPRKHAQLVFNTFIDLFGESDDVSLTIKSDGPTDVRYDPGIAGFLSRPDFFKNVSIIESEYTDEQMVSLLHFHDVLVYFSAGEGFGFIPIQAMATGMPVIMNTEWCDYSKFSVGLELESTFGPSPWQMMHPGNVFHPVKDSIREQMSEAYENYQRYADLAYSLAPQIHKEYNWLYVVNKAFSPVERELRKK